MFPFRYSSIFRSRWIALFWAAGIVWMALDIAGKPRAHDGNDSAAAADRDTGRNKAPSDIDVRRAQDVLKRIGG